MEKAFQEFEAVSKKNAAPKEESVEVNAAPKEESVEVNAAPKEEIIVIMEDILPIVQTKIQKFKESSWVSILECINSANLSNFNSNVKSNFKDIDPNQSSFAENYSLDTLGLLSQDDLQNLNKAIDNKTGDFNLGFNKLDIKTIDNLSIKNNKEQITQAMHSATEGIKKGSSSEEKRILLEKIKQDFSSADNDKDASVHLALFVRIAGAHRNTPLQTLFQGRPKSLITFDIAIADNPNLDEALRTQLKSFIDEQMNIKTSLSSSLKPR